MKWAISILSVLTILAWAIFLVFLDAPVATADDSFDFFTMEVEHGINGRILGAPKSFPIVVKFSVEGATLLEVPLSFKNSFAEILPTGVYTITVESSETGPLSTMTVGPVEMFAGDDLRLKAVMGAGRDPVLRIK